MARRLACPKCQAILFVDTTAAHLEIACSSCGAKLRLTAPATAVAAPPEEPVTQDVPRKKKKKKKKPKTLSTRALLGLVFGALAAMLVLIVVVVLLTRGPRGGGGGGGDGEDYAVVDEPVDPVAPAPAAEEPDPPAAPVALRPRPKWQGQVDPRTEPLADLTAAPGVPITGLPVLAAGDGPFVLDVPPEYGLSGRIKLERVPGGGVRYHAPELRPVPVVDLRTGQTLEGAFPPTAPVTPYSRLGPDGRYLAGPDWDWDLEKGTPKTDDLLIWERGAAEPKMRLRPGGPVVWLDFVGSERLAVVIFGEKPTFQVIDIAKRTAPVAVALPTDDFPPTTNADAQGVLSLYRPWRYGAAVSPGGRYVALGGRTGVVLLTTADGKAVGTLPAGSNLVFSDYLGLRFADDGALLRAVVNSSRERVDMRLRVWSVADGRSVRDVALSDPQLCGNPLAGPEPGTVVLPIRNERTGQGRVERDVERPPHVAFRVGAGAVVDEATGVALAPLGYSPLCGGGDKAHLGYGETQYAVNAAALKQAALKPPRPTTVAVFVAAYNRADLQAKAEKARVDHARQHPNATQRPDVVAVDRAGLVVAVPQPPAAWSVPAAAAPPPTLPTGVTLPVVPTAYADAEAAVVTFGEVPVDSGRERVAWERWDLRTGKLIGDALTLWPQSGRIQRPGSALSVPLVAALSPDGTWLALRDVLDPMRVDVWDTTGKRLTGLMPCGAAVDWLGWAAGGRLLALGDGRLSGWDVIAHKALFEIDGGYATTAFLPPGRAWVAVQGPSSVDVLDTATGRCLGRCALPPVAAEGNQRVAARVVSLSPVGKTLVASGFNLPTRVWDMATGKAETLRDITGLSAVWWCGPRRFLSPFGIGYQLYDLDLKTLAVSYMPSQHKSSSLAGDPTGSVWLLHGPKERKRIVLPGAQGDEAELAAGAPPIAFPKGAVVRVEIDLGDRTKSRDVARRTAQTVQARGLTVGPNAWALRGRTAVRDTGNRLNDLETGKPSVSLIALEMEWRLIAPDGSEVWKGIGASHNWDRQASRYFDRGRSLPAGPQGGMTVYDFGGRDPRAAMVEELREKFLDTMTFLPDALPRAVVKTANGYKALPLVGTIDD